jgi:uncharacterized protein RhaS with RHS repeats
MRHCCLAGLALLTTCGASAAHAAETLTYRYDARGRLIKVERTGTVNNGVVTTYGHDKADNRVTKTTIGSPNPGPP